MFHIITVFIIWHLNVFYWVIYKEQTFISHSSRDMKIKAQCTYRSKISWGGYLSWSFAAVQLCVNEERDDSCILTWQDVKEQLDCGVVLPLENINPFNDGRPFMTYTFKILKYEIYQFIFQALFSSHGTNQLA